MKIVSRECNWVGKFSKFKEHILPYWTYFSAQKNFKKKGGGAKFSHKKFLKKLYKY